MGRVGQTKEEKYHIISLVCSETKNKLHKRIYLQNRLTDLENECMVTRQEGLGEGVVRQFGIHMYTTALLTTDNQQGLAV